MAGRRLDVALALLRACRRGRRRSGGRALAAPLGLALVFTAVPARAFDVVPFKSPVHQDITKTAAKAEGWATGAIQNLQKFNISVDGAQHKFNDDGVLVTNDDYNFASHLDRTKDGANFRTSAATFETGRDLVLDRIAAARKASQDQKPEAALEALGQALHAVQDLNAHSNLVDLSAADQATLLKAVFDKAVAPPAGLKLTSYATTKEAGEPKDDPLGYTHDSKAKDSSKKNAEAMGKPAGSDKTRFELASASAVTYSRAVLQKFADGLAADDVKGVSQSALLAPHPGDAFHRFVAAGQYTPGSAFALSAGGTTLAFGPTSFGSPQRVELYGSPLNLFRETDELFAADGRMMGLLRQVSPLDVGVPVLSPGSATVAFDLAEVDFLRPETLKVFYLDPEAESWTEVSGAAVSVDLAAGTGVASFDIGGNGLYGVGGFSARAVPEPGVLALGGSAALTLLGHRWGRRRAARPEPRRGTGLPVP